MTDDPSRAFSRPIRTGRLKMPAEQFDALAGSLDVPDEAPALARLEDRPRRYRHT